tara:strand:- start:119 stop:1816 length:1698 start_codon:yes stop_codon:yes gene_type:complete
MQPKQFRNLMESARSIVHPIIENGDHDCKGEDCPKHDHENEDTGHQEIKHKGKTCKEAHPGMEHEEWEMSQNESIEHLYEEDLSDAIGNAILKSKKIKKGAKASDIISAISNELRNMKKPKLSRNALAYYMRDRDFLADTIDVVKRGLKESVELDESVWRTLEQRHHTYHDMALDLIAQIQGVDSPRKAISDGKWIDSFGSKISAKLPKGLDVEKSGTVEYQQNRGRGDWSFTIDTLKGDVKYIHKGKSGKFKNTVDFGKYIRSIGESVELDEIDRTKLKNKLGAEVARVTHGDKKHTPKTNKQAKLLRKLQRQARTQTDLGKQVERRIKRDGPWNTYKESVELDEASQRFGGDTNIPASPEIKKHIESGKAKILMNVKSALHPSARFLVIKNPKTGSNQDKVLMAITSDPERSRIKMFSFHGTHTNEQGALKFAKHHKLIAKPVTHYQTHESVELDEVKISRNPQLRISLDKGRPAGHWLKTKSGTKEKVSRDDLQAAGDLYDRLKTKKNEDSDYKLSEATKETLGRYIVKAVADKKDREKGIEKAAKKLWGRKRKGSIGYSEK